MILPWNFDVVALFDNAQSCMHAAVTVRTSRDTCDVHLHILRMCVGYGATTSNSKPILTFLVIRSG